MPGGYTPVVNVGYAETPLAVGPDGKTALIMSEEEEDLRDALCPIYDQLSLAPSWWFLELFPMRHREQRDDDHWIGNWSYVIFSLYSFFAHPIQMLTNIFTVSTLAEAVKFPSAFNAVKNSMFIDQSKSGWMLARTFQGEDTHQRHVSGKSNQIG